jgi:hypothetical protein
VVIDAELGREDHGLIHRNCDREKAGTDLMSELTPVPNYIKLMVKAKKISLVSFFKSFITKKIRKNPSLNWFSVISHILHYNIVRKISLVSFLKSFIKLV